MRKRYLTLLVLILAMAFSLLTPAVAGADSGSGPYYLGVAGGRDAYVRGGRVLQESDFGPDFRPRPGDQVFFGETLYHSTARGARGTRAGRSEITCVFGVRQTAFCDGTIYLRGQGQLYVTTSTARDRRFLIAILGGTRTFKAVRGDIVGEALSDLRTLYRLRLR